MTYRKSDAQRSKEYLNRYLTINNPRNVTDPELRSIINSFNLEFVKLYNKSMEAVLAEELKANGGILSLPHLQLPSSPETK